MGPEAGRHSKEREGKQALEGKMAGHESILAETPSQLEP
jgi:hypothetical protein